MNVIIVNIYNIDKYPFNLIKKKKKIFLIFNDR